MTSPGLFFSVVHRPTPPNKGTRAPPTTAPASLFPGNSGPKITSSLQGRGQSQGLDTPRRSTDTGEEGTLRQPETAARSSRLYFHFILVFPPCSWFPCLTVGSILFAHLRASPYFSCHLGTGIASSTATSSRKPAMLGCITAPLACPLLHDHTPSVKGRFSPLCW